MKTAISLPDELFAAADAFNASALRTVVAVILTSNLRLADAPGNVRVGARETGLRQESVANVSQVLTVDRRFLTERVGQVRAATLERIADGLRLVLAL